LLFKFFQINFEVLAEYFTSPKRPKTVVIFYCEELWRLTLEEIRQPSGKLKVTWHLGANYTTLVTPFVIKETKILMNALKSPLLLVS